MGRFFDRRVAARPESDGSDFYVAEIFERELSNGGGGVLIGSLERKFRRRQ